MTLLSCRRQECNVSSATAAELFFITVHTRALTAASCSASVKDTSRSSSMSILFPRRRMGTPSPAASWRRQRAESQVGVSSAAENQSPRPDDVCVRSSKVKRTWTLASHGFTALKLSATVTSYISTTPSALRKNCLVMLRNLWRWTWKNVSHSWTFGGEVMIVAISSLAHLVIRVISTGSNDQL